MATLTTTPPLSTPTYLQHNETQPTSGAVVRTHGIHFIRRHWQNISKASKFMLVSSVFFIVSQIIVSVTILVIYRFDSCDKPLDTYLTVHVVRVGLLLPFVVHQYLTRPLFSHQQHHSEHGLTNNNQQRTPQAASETQNANSSRLSASPLRDSSSPYHARPGISFPPNSLSVNPNSNSEGTIKDWCERLKSLLDLFGILWFIVGNYLLFTSETCTVAAPGHYYTILTWVLLNYLVILVPIILCASVIFCLPGVLVILRLFNVAEVPGMTMGASKDEILTIPIYKYESQESGELNPGTDSTIHQHKKPFSASTKSWTRRLFFRSKGEKHDIEAKSYPPITMSCLEDAVCSICLSEYETGDLLCKLWCSHHFHRDCVHEWLGLNSLCPLCKQNFRGKEPSDDIALSMESANTATATRTNDPTL